jgi:hypothetical protein
MITISNGYVKVPGYQPNGDDGLDMIHGADLMYIVGAALHSTLNNPQKG